MPLTDKELKERDAKRNIGEELLTAIQDVKAGRYGAVQHVERSLRLPKQEARQGSHNPNLPSFWACQ